MWMSNSGHDSRSLIQEPIICQITIENLWFTFTYKMSENGKTNFTEIDFSIQLIEYKICCCFVTTTHPSWMNFYNHYDVSKADATQLCCHERNHIWRIFVLYERKGFSIFNWNSKLKSTGKYETNIDFSYH